MASVIPAEPDRQPGCRLTRDEAAVITAVDDAIVDLLGWAPEDLVGSPSTEFIHPEDQGSAVSAWFEMVKAPGSTKRWRGRYRTADGGWRWVEAENTNHLADPAEPVVVTVMRPITVERVSMEEELRAREQLLTRLSDAIPVGLFQIDAQRRVTFTNDRLHAILGVAAKATVDAQFAELAADDREPFAAALARVLDDELVDDLELRLSAPVEGGGGSSPRVCLVSLRALTDGTGTVTGAIGCLSDVTDRVRLRRELEIRAAIDTLTGCLNRAAVLELLDLMLDRVGPPENGLAVVFVDLDRFKDVNDRFGHATGDRFLAEVADRMRAVVRGDDRIGRIGGDEFLIVCPNVVEPSAAVDVAERVAAALDAAVRVDGHDIASRASVGVAWTDRRPSPDELIARADEAMYASKRAAAGGVVLAT